MHEREPATENRIRDTYSEYQRGSTTMGMISDPDNEQAWIRSTLTVPVEP